MPASFNLLETSGSEYKTSNAKGGNESRAATQQGRPKGEGGMRNHTCNSISVVITVGRECKVQSRSRVSRSKIRGKAPIAFVISMTGDSGLAQYIMAVK